MNPDPFWWSMGTTLYYCRGTIKKFPCLTENLGIRPSKRSRCCVTNSSAQDSPSFSQRELRLPKSFYESPVIGKFKVQIFWEGHKILQNLHCRFVLCSANQIYSGYFAKFWDLLRIYELSETKLGLFWAIWRAWISCTDW